MDLDQMATQLRASGRYRVLDRFQRRDSYHERNGEASRRALYVDVETTGLDPSSDRIIQLAAVPFHYCPGSGRIYDVGEALIQYEDPERPIPDFVTQLTGITDADVAGRRIDDRAVHELVESCCLVVAHNADFDRRFLQRRLPVFAERAWACSCRDVPWRDLGIESSKLEYVAIRVSSIYYEGHRADEDCLVAIHVLAHEDDDGRSIFSRLLESARRTTVRIWALGTAYEIKNVLKSRGYCWSGRRRSWYIDVTPEQEDAEGAWLREEVYHGRQKWKREEFDATKRYSEEYYTKHPA
jgi:DNA polymerase-3 subunit epsilon